MYSNNFVSILKESFPFASLRAGYRLSALGVRKADRTHGEFLMRDSSLGKRPYPYPLHPHGGGTSEYYIERFFASLRMTLNKRLAYLPKGDVQ